MERAGQLQGAQQQQQGVPPLLFRRQRGEGGAALPSGLSRERWVVTLGLLGERHASHHQQQQQL